MKSEKKKFKLKDESLFIVLGVLLLLYFLSMFLLFFWAGVTSFKEADSYFFGDKVGFDNTFTFQNYIDCFTVIKVSRGNSNEQSGFLMMYLYSILYTVGSAFLGTFVSAITAYLCAKFPYKFSGIIVGTVLVTMALPIVGSTPSAIQLAQDLGLYNQIWGLWIMSASFHTGVHFLILYESFRQVPLSYKEAAEIDGASQLQVMFRIMMPLIRSAFVTIFLLRFIGLWNDYQTPLLYMPYYPTISYGLYSYVVVSQGGDAGPTQNVPHWITAALLVAIPMFIVFVAFQKKIMTNISIGGIKG